MGRNNHHAGLHLKRFTRYGDLDDLAYYDELAARKAVVSNTPIQLPETPNDTQPAHITEAKPDTIDIRHFYYPEIVMANIMLRAIYDKRDIVAIINKIERLMASDETCISGKQSPMLGNSLCFLSMLARKLKCPVSQLLDDDKYDRSMRVNNLLSELDAYKNEFVINTDENYTELVIRNFDFTYGMTRKIYKVLEDRMDLRLSREALPDGTYWYTLSFGNLYEPSNANDLYMLKGAYLWEEETGKLEQFVEKILK